MSKDASLWRYQFTSPLLTDWTPQYCRLKLAGIAPNTPLLLTINGQATPFQYTGRASAAGAEILVKLGFARNETKELVFTAQPGGHAEPPASRRELPLTGPVSIGFPGRELLVGASAPFLGFAGQAMASRIHCEAPCLSATLAQTNAGPLFTDYELGYDYGEGRRYTLALRCYQDDPYIEVSETFSLGLGAALVWTLNPAKQFTHIISRDSFEGENQPSIEALGLEHPRDVLCRLQMPVLTEYFIPNNRGWFAFFDQRHEARGMVGVLGLYGAQWAEPVANMPELFDRQGTVEWHAALVSGKRFWLLYHGPVQKQYAMPSGPAAGAPALAAAPAPNGEPRFLFHRLHAEFNALRLDENLDLTGEQCFDESCAQSPGALGRGDFHAHAQANLAAYPGLQQVLPNPDDWLKANGALHLSSYRYLLAPTPAHAEELYGHLEARFTRWVRQFQGYRTGQGDYMKNVIGFSRYLRGMLLAYEQLRRDGALSTEQVHQLNAWFAFAARRILDEGRWPHSRTMLHPDHPESSRDFYTYGGEHKPDRLAWTNCLPNFQSDPLCALAHLSAIFKNHPDASYWRRFALDDLDRQLDAYCGQSGAWEESINYALYTFSYLVITFKAVKERWGLDYFNDARVRRLVSWLCRFFGPYDKRFGAYTWPAIGNAVLPQNQAELLLCYAAELPAGDPLRDDCLAIWQLCAAHCRPAEHYPVVMAALAPLPAALSATAPSLRPLTSEVMDEVGVALRHRHTQPNESYLFQKIGFAKDHYEADETAFNWYAKGTPLCMDYGTYTGDVAVGGAHNVVEIPDEDSLRRGYLADHLFSPAVDYTRCEVPVTLKLLWGRVRSFAEVENKDGKIDRTKTPYFYIGDKNPVGPKVWKVRQMFFVKPDYVALFDRVYGQVPHRYNLHVTGSELRREGALLQATGRFDLDLLAFVQHPPQFTLATGELVPKVHPRGGGDDARQKHAQHYFRLSNHTDGLYRTLLFAKERQRQVQVNAFGEHGLQVITPEYTDYLFLHNDFIEVAQAGVVFHGRAGWIRQSADGTVQACLADGEELGAFGQRFVGRGPWTYNLRGDGQFEIRGATPRSVVITPA